QEDHRYVDEGNGKPTKASEARGAVARQQGCASRRPIAGKERKRRANRLERQADVQQDREYEEDRKTLEPEQVQVARAPQPLLGQRVLECVADRLGRLHHGGHEGRAYAMRAWGNKDAPPGRALNCRRLASSEEPARASKRAGSM